MIKAQSSKLQRAMRSLRRVLGDAARRYLVWRLHRAAPTLALGLRGIDDAVLQGLGMPRQQINRAVGELLCAVRLTATRQTNRTVSRGCAGWTGMAGTNAVAHAVPCRSGELSMSEQRAPCP